MARGPVQEKFIIDGNKLTVRGELGPEDEKPYSEVLFELLSTGQYELVIDFTELDHMSSSYIGATCLAAMMAKQNRRSVTILARKEIKRVLQMTGVDKLTKVQLVPD